MYWFFLAIAILLEVLGTTCMKLSEGFARLVPSVMVFILYFASFAFMILALKKMELGVVYAIWAGLGAAGMGLGAIRRRRRRAGNSPQGWPEANRKAITEIIERGC